MSPRAWIRVVFIVFVCLLAQSTVLDAIRIAGIHPDIVWLIPISAALIDGPETGAIVGFWAGLAFDLVIPTPFGLTALVGCLLGYSTGSATAAMDRRVGWLRPTAALIGSVGADMLFAVLGAILGQQEMVQINFAALFGVIAVSAVILVMPVNRMMRWALTTETHRSTLIPAHAADRVW